jgi:hypothetical protein
MSVTPSVMSIDGLYWWYNHAAHVLSIEFNSIQYIQFTSHVWHWTCQSQFSLLQHWLFLLTWVRNKYTSPSAIQEKNQPKIISIEINPVSWFEKGDKSGAKVLICIGRLPQSYQNKWYQKQWLWVTSLLHYKWIYFIEMHVYCTAMYVYCTAMYVCCIYSRYISYSSICPLVVYSYAT